MANVLIIGAGGQIAADLIPKLYAQGHQLTLVDRTPPDQVHSWHHLRQLFRDEPDWQSWWRVVDVSREPADYKLISEVRPDVVYHLAALLSARCEDDPRRCWRLNMAAFRNVLEDLLDLSTADYRPQLIWPSSIAAFGPPLERAGANGDGGKYHADNDYPLLPKTMYGVSKVACELMGSYFAGKWGVDFRSVRFPGLLNTAEPGGGSSDYANAMYFGAASGKGSAISFVRADARIPFMYMGDAVEALVQLAAVEESRLTCRVYNIRAFPAPSAAEIAASIAREVPGFTVTYDPDHRQRIVDSWPDDFDDSLARRDWGWRPQVDSLDAMTRRLLADFRAQRAAK